jgi:hypothetical protein
MKCSEVRQALPEVMEMGQDHELDAHLEGCPACSELVSDLKLISSGASQLAASDEPSPRVWIRIAAQLRAEGLIREPESAPAFPVPSSTPNRRSGAWWLVPIAAALVAAGSYVVSHKQTIQMTQQGPSVPQTSTPQTSVPQPQPPAPPTQTHQAQNQTSVAQGAPASTAPQQKASNPPEVAEGPSAEDQQFLSEVSERAPSMRATYESQLGSVNSSIREAQAYLDRNPDDEDARQHLMEAYQQKAMLYQMALEHVQ